MTARETIETKVQRLMTARAENMMLDAFGMNKESMFHFHTTSLAQGSCEPMTAETIRNAIDAINGDSLAQQKRLIILFCGMGFEVIASAITDNKPRVLLPARYCEAVKELRDEQEKKEAEENHHE